MLDYQKLRKRRKLCWKTRKRAFFKPFRKDSLDDSPAKFERPRKKIISNPFAKKFEDMAKNAKKDEEVKMKRALRKSKSTLNRSKQLLCKLSQDNIKKITEPA